MRKIGKLQNEKDAQTLSNYLLSKDIDNVVKSSSAEHVIWAQNEDHLPLAKEILQEFINNPQDPKYKNVVIKKMPKKKRRRKVTIFLGPQYPYLTHFFILTSVIVTILCHAPQFKQTILEYTLLLQNPFGRYLTRHGTIITPIWTVITPIFVHWGVIHLLMNMLAMHYLGFLIEGKQGSIFYLTQILVIATISNTAEFIFSPGLFGGMSGVLYGQFGYLWIRGKLDIGWGIRLSDSAIKSGLVWLFLCWFVIPNIANYAHTAGLLCGMLWGYLAAQES